MAIYVDHTHIGRHVTGLERITLELFSRQALAPLDVTPVTARGAWQMAARQTLGLPLRLAASRSILLCPGFPPSPLLRPFAARVLPYIHDDFLISRRDELNRRAKLYMAAPFALALRTYPRFLANSLDTRERMRRHCRADAQIALYRPSVRNVFGLDADTRGSRDATRGALRVVTLGTVEPRKNFRAAARVVEALRARGYSNATLDIIGRKGWGDDWQALEALPYVNLRGYQDGVSVRALLDAADLFICTSHAEGLGLPLLEAQYGGLPVVAPDAPVFREVLGESGIFIDPADPDASAAVILAAIADASWRPRHAALAARNLARWNELARSDRGDVIEMIMRLAQDHGAMTGARPDRADLSANANAPGR